MELTPIHRLKADQIQLATGDILLFSGRGAFSEIIKKGSNSRFSHVGLIVDLKDVGFDRAGWAVFESTTMGTLPDLVTGKKIKGVQLVPYLDRVRQYDGKVYLRKRDGWQLTQERRDTLLAFFQEVHGRPYEDDKIDLMAAALPWLRDSEKDIKTLFCSETVAELYQRWELLAHEYPSDCFDPAWFGDVSRHGLANTIFGLKA